MNNNYNNNPIPNNYDNNNNNPSMHANNNYNNQANNYNPNAWNDNRPNTAPFYNPYGSNSRLTTQISNNAQGGFHQITGCTSSPCLNGGVRNLK